MHFSTTTLFFALFTTTSLSAPVSTPNLAHSIKSRALTSVPYNTFSISSGVGGSALSEANTAFPITPSSSTSASDLSIINAAAKVSEQAEVGTGGFNDAIAAAGGQGTTEGKALQVGKIKNKVLKLQTDVLRLEIQAAKGKGGLDAQIQQQKTKLAANVKLDEANKGVTSKGINFAG
ncbi:uncharacterized protein RAG0_12297 [Rhynchosporium agropyri]|uniref:Small secreted protein n=2 Tax=Rhynchosporium TaxID=38037 RepID=A0A1E1L7Y7_9HELO|nr:uncharacterized protein RCO7_05704 [Rhynchosporium commune]CZT06616.1 uncharacterized protein RAG0_12297 [Rhynchosporium agropyri]